MSNIRWFVFILVVIGFFLFYKPAQVKAEYTVYSRDPFSPTVIIPSTNPHTEHPKEIITANTILKLFVSRGQYESTSAAIFNDSGTTLQNVNVTISTLTKYSAPTSTIDSVEVQAVKVIQKRKAWAQAALEPSIFSPEVLIPFTDNYKQRGEFTVPTNSSKEWWITVNVPATAVPGVYVGTLRIDPESPSTEPTKQYPVSLTVSSATLLAHPTQLNGFYYSPINSYTNCFVSPCQTVPRYSLQGTNYTAVFQHIIHQDFAMLQKMGIQTIVPSLPTSLAWSASLQKVTINANLLSILFDEMKLAGLASHPFAIFALTTDQTYAQIRTLIANNTSLTSTALDARTDETFQEIVRTADTLRRQKQLPEIYFYPVDEPFHSTTTPEKRAWLQKAATLIREAVPGAKIWTTIAFNQWFGGTMSAQLRADYEPYVDIHDYNASMGILSLLGNTITPSQLKTYLSDHHAIGYTYDNEYIGSPFLHRIEHGLYLWNLPLVGNIPWSFQHVCKDPFSDIEVCAANDGEWTYAYPDFYNPDALLPAARLYGVREGIDDNRYMTTLQAAIDQSSDAVKKQEAQTLLTQIKSVLNNGVPNHAGIAERVSPGQIEDWRRQMAALIVSLGQPREPTPTPSPTPVPGHNGDANGDGKVDGWDYVIWLNHYLHPNVTPATGDFDGDGKVDGHDYVIWLNHYLQ